ncbi:hypothetical protein [Streptomyces sp. WAC00469]|uniref:hypothetical protein n=1 Tax=Streptomyces sp. WAC00469 TaxID=2487415 RepID=UPI0028AB7BB7|nr:hypothetical protein [Streptomyces sp. WAC00469]
MKRVDAVLRDLESSAGNPMSVEAQTISQTSLRSGSAPFREASDLYEQYNAVHERLTTLSKTLHLQIEAIGIAVQGAHQGFENLEEEQRRRFWEIQMEIKKLQLRKKGGENTADGTGLKA